jgi:hypothetical protein
MKKIILLTIIVFVQFSCSSLVVRLNQQPYESGQVGIVSYNTSMFKGLNSKRRALALKYATSVCGNMNLVREYNTTNSITTGYDTKRTYSGSYQSTAQGQTTYIRVIEFRCR